MSSNWLDTFHPWSAVHAGVLLLFGGLWWGIISWAANRRASPTLIRGERIFAALMLTVWIVAEGYWALPAHFDPAYSLPIHICDLTALVVPLVFFTRKRLLNAILYFWGYGLSLQAIITPELHFGPRHFDFWLFWGYHSMIMGAAAYVLIVHRYRPTWRDWGYGIAASAVYLAIILPVDIAFRFNYGFLGEAQPTQTTLIDALGPWPQRVFVICALVAVMMTLLLLPWEWHRRRTRQRAA